MKIHFLRAAALVLGFSVWTPASAEFGQNGAGQYVAPQKWSNFNSSAPVAATAAQSVSIRAGLTPLTAASQGTSQVRTVSNAPMPSPMAMQNPSDCSPSTQFSAPMVAAPMDGNCQSGPGCTADGFSETPGHHSPYAAALNSPWSDCDGPSGATCAPARPALSPWFASGDILFWTMANQSYRRLILESGASDNVLLSTNDIAPDYTTGYSVSAGRYLDCGRYGLGFSYLNFDPSAEESIARTAVPGAHYAAMPHWNNISIDHDGDTTADTVYDIFDNSAAQRARRDVSIQGAEVNLFSFGLMGARRIAPACGTGLGCGPLSKVARALHLPGGRGYSGALGPIERPTGGTVQVMTSHGFRWFQFEDEFELASTDAYDGYTGPSDLFYDSNVTNDLYGYQFGGRLLYCLGPRLSANFGGKAGIYGNDVYVEQRIGTSSTLAYVNGDPTQTIATSDRDVVLAGLGEVDLGLAYRLNSAWTISGGYRMLYATGVATSIGSIANEYYSVSGSASAYADDSLLLHGAYFGTAFNW